MQWLRPGPKQTRDMLARFFSRPDIRTQLRDDVDVDMLAIYLLNCIGGAQYSRLLFEPVKVSRAQVMRELEQRLELFYRGVLK
jgi:TetR/AcrR family transcriptional repressor of mexJK operon